MERITTQTKVIREGAHFESQESFNKHCSMTDTTVSSLKRCGVPLDYLPDKTYATSTDEHHVLIVGDTGCGKTRRLIVPTIRLLSKTGQSMVISDPKGELYQKTARGLVKRGYDLKVLNFRNPRRGQRWNPFTVIENLYRSAVPENKDKALLMLQDILDIMKKNVHSERDTFWENVAEQYLTAMILSILEYGTPGSLSFMALSSFESEISSWVREYCTNTNRIEPVEEKGHFKALNAFLNALPEDSPIRNNFNSFLSVADDLRPLESISMESHVMANIYSKQSTLQYLLSDSDFDIKDLGRKPMVFFIILPDDSEAMYPLATMFVNQVYSQMVDLAYENGGLLPNPVNFVLDEFANFTRLPNFRSMLTASRSRRMRLFLVVQDVDQLVAQYSPTEAAIIRSNCQDWVFMGCRNLDFLDMLVRISGTHFDKYTGVGSPLVSLTDLLTLQKGETVVWIRGCNPKRCWLPDYSDVDFGDEDISETDFPPQNEELPDKVGSFMEILKNSEDDLQFSLHEKQEKPKTYEEDLTDDLDELIDEQTWDSLEDDDSEEESF